MSYHVLFSFSTGLAKTIRVPKGTNERITRHVANLEQTLGLERERPYTPEGQEPKGWRWSNLGTRLDDFKDAESHFRSDETLCSLLSKHRQFVKWLYKSLDEWAKTPPAEAEDLTPEQAVEWWHALHTPEPPLARWSRDYYVAKMEDVYKTLRGRDNGDFWKYDGPPLTPEQASGVIGVFEQWLDNHDMRLEVPHDCDGLRSSYDGGYTWCETCGAVAEEYRPEAEAGNCGRASKRKCNLYQEAKEMDARDARHQKEREARNLANLIQDSRDHGEERGSATLQKVLDLLEIPKGWRRQQRQLEIWRTLQEAVRLGWLTMSTSTPPVYTRTNRSTGRTAIL